MSLQTDARRAGVTDGGDEGRWRLLTNIVAGSLCCMDALLHDVWALDDAVNARIAALELRCAQLENLLANLNAPAPAHAADDDAWAAAYQGALVEELLRALPPPGQQDAEAHVSEAVEEVVRLELAVRVGDRMLPLLDALATAGLEGPAARDFLLLHRLTSVLLVGDGKSVAAYVRQPSAAGGRSST